jgi:RND family efflux transporter MFP subunit
MKTKNIVIIVTIILVGIIAYVLFQNKQEMNIEASTEPEEFAIPVQVAQVKQETLSTALTATGEFKGWEEVTLVAESQGSIQTLNAEEGQQIKKGQIIAKIEAVSLNSQLASARSAFSKAEKDVERYERLEQVGAVSQSQLEEARIQRENARSNIAQIQQQLGFTTVKSPIDGVVNSLMVEETSFVLPGNEIAQIVQIDRLKVELQISETNLAQISEDQKVTIKTDVFPLKTFEGTVQNISVKADESQKFKVTIVVENPDNTSLRAGMFATVIFEELASSQETATTIPRNAIVGSLQTPQVFVVNDSVARLKEIQTGAVIDNKVVVLGGLEEGTQVVTKGIINLTDGTKVKITNK